MSPVLTRLQKKYLLRDKLINSKSGENIEETDNEKLRSKSVPNLLSEPVKTAMKLKTNRIGQKKMDLTKGITPNERRRIERIFLGRTISAINRMEKRKLERLKKNKSVCTTNKYVCKHNKSVCKSNKSVSKSNKSVCKSNKSVCKPNKYVCKSNKTGVTRKKATNVTNKQMQGNFLTLESMALARCTRCHCPSFQIFKTLPTPKQKRKPANKQLKTFTRCKSY